MLMLEMVDTRRFLWYHTSCDLSPGGEQASTGEQNGKARAEAPVLVKNGKKKKANTAQLAAA